MLNTVVITGSSNGIGKAAAEKFIANGYHVHGIDKDDAPVFRCKQPYGKYTHHKLDIAADELPNIENVSILINNAGQQTPASTYHPNHSDDIEVNLKALIKCTQKYGLHKGIRSIINLASVSAHNGAEYPAYTASKGGVLSYTVWTAKEIAKYGATCNSISFGGVRTDLNAVVMNDKTKWDDIMSMTPLQKWATADECADWIYFLSVINKSMTGQDLIIDNGEMINHRFVW